MNASQIEKNVIALVENFNKEEFVFDLLKAYGISKTSITRLKKGDFNLSKAEGEVLYKSKMLFKEIAAGSLLNTIDELTKDVDSLKHNPRFVIVTDYKTLLAKDIRTGLALDTPILEIHKHFGFFLPWAGQEKYAQKNENFADRKASEKMAKMYDILVQETPGIYDDGGHNLNIFLSRLLFCFFAEDTDIFPIEGMFTDTLEQHTQKDGSDTHTFLDRLFKVLNTKDNSKEADHFKEFPYVNGGLFRDTIVSPKFTAAARKIIIECGDLDWSEINPDIFGSMIQAVVNPTYRSGLGMHYTSVPNIMKVIEPLFLNELNEEFEKHFNDVKKLNKLINRIAKIKVFDPACGSGNFLIIAYKQLRRLEIKILARIYEVNHQLNLGFPDVYTKIKLSQFYGIELDDFAHEMAILSLWLAEHQMNKEFISELHDYGKAEDILPLKEAGHITQGNATRLDWEDTCPKNDDDEIYILGNPPYLGARLQDVNQKRDVELAFRGSKEYKDSDYITCWFILGAEFIRNSKSKLSYVSTNSICQGEQVAYLWPKIFDQNIEIDFAYPSFKWTNNAKGNAGVTVVIIGIRNNSSNPKYLISGSHKGQVININPYLTAGPTVFINKRSKPISFFLPQMVMGSMARDGGNLILTTEEKEKLLQVDNSASILLRPLFGSAEFIQGKERWCLWIKDDQREFAESISNIKERINKVFDFRVSSKAKTTNGYSSIPHKFAQRSPSDVEALIIPRVSSELREYLPIGFLDSNCIVSDSAQAIFNPEPWILGLISSKIHTVWIKAVGGKLETRIRYSASVCYNTFPFPEISQKQKEQINLHVFEILEEREKHSGKTMAQLYDPNKMPKGLKEAHHQLDLAIERCYRLKPFESDTERLEYLFKEYEKMINKNTLLDKPKRTRKKKA
ncbi:class I SAM-dependent DNA methyltransferase [Zobellia roscoffensis]|uniref:class I SAM-dependent DNA methyltransferase n=1 Tax=Zobellia roscoffensis TaxID=2779508 RepID=UPI00188B648F|nr:DNA methyltransferase [Zobellia roscoffensis]